MKKKFEQDAVIPEAEIENSGPTRRAFTRGVLGAGLLGITGAGFPSWATAAAHGDDEETEEDMPWVRICRRYR